MQSLTFDYKHLNKAGFDSKACSVVTVTMPNQKTSTKASVYDTSTSAPLCQNQHSAQEIVTFTVEFVPFIVGKQLLVKAYSLIKDVHSDKYIPEPFTLCIHKKDGSIDTKTTVNDVIIQKVELFLNRKNEATGEMGYIRIRFTLQGLNPDKK
ncbi:MULTISPECIES: hypothetical protein [Candidatus Cardinium]|uniref:hypothetical protein n=1 Tax=Candidatus Cardinium TaxID=273135 RepID=UPI001FAA2F75|nr:MULTISPECIES: hypothetical protein [Cardinium]